MKRKLVGWLLVGLPVAIMLGLFALAGGGRIVLYAAGVIGAIVFVRMVVDRGLELLKDD